MVAFPLKKLFSNNLELAQTSGILKKSF